MKQLLIILFFIPAVCFGQKKGYQIKGSVMDSTVEVLKIKGLDDGGRQATTIGSIMSGIYATPTNVFGTSWFTPGDRLNTFTITPKNDTVKVIILFCDTAFTTGEQDHRFSYYAYCQFGYEVKYYARGIDGLHYQFMSGYLDENKKPLLKSVVVWMSKEIKN